MVIKEDGIYYNWVIYNKLEGSFVQFRGTTRKANDLYNHLNELSIGKTELYRDGKLVK